MPKHWKCTQCSTLVTRGFMDRVSEGDPAECENCGNTEFRATKTIGLHHRLLDAFT